MKTRKILDLSDKLSLMVKGDEATFTLVDEGEEIEHNVFLTIEELRQLRNWLTDEVLQDQITGGLGSVVAIRGPVTPADFMAPTPNLQGPIAAGPVVATKEIIEAQKSAKLEDRRAISLGPTELKSYPQLSSKISSSDQFQVHDMSSQVGAKSTEAFSKEGLKKGDA